MFKELAIINSA
jgi:hypothetical protein